MAFDQGTRNHLQKFVSESRDILTEEFTRQLQATYGLDPKNGTIAEIETLDFLDNKGLQTATILRETLAHYVVAIPGKSEKERTKQALDRIIREQAFTVLNRLGSLRMAEARGFLLESIAKGYSSKGFQLYKNLAGSALGETGNAYRCFLFSLFDEFSLDLAVLFDRHSPQGRLFPREAALLALLAQINHLEIEHLWAEDETIGWIYQYFNSEEERKKMRAESQAPRNSRELAVRNQFFTPRYVVEFLTDNTLGRIWYEMTQGKTSLVESCRYLVRRPTEIFLAKGVEAPEQNSEKQERLTQEELLKQPVYIPFRPLKDPRELRMLDPACGSMHFGLYAFDLFEKIYEEAWQIETDFGLDAFEHSKKLHSLQTTYSCFEEFQKDIPKLIIEQNIHGVDIDPRAVQIAGISLWQRAQRSWHQMGIKPNQRPVIKKSNIVCAEPMPGEKEMLQEFTAKLNPPVLGQLVETIFDKMELAGEAGTLLKIEEEIKTAIREAKKSFNEEILRQKKEEGYLPGMAPKRQPTIFDFAKLHNDTEFWDTAEERILSALSKYSEQAESNDGQKRIFAEDVAKGFAFIDLCHKRYDAIVMNPPFGEFTKAFKDYASKKFPRSKPDILCMFVERMSELLEPNCSCAAITNRTPFFTDGTEAWREAYCLGGEATTISLFADLGHKVLDAALVETAAYCVTRASNQRELLWFNLTQFTDKESSLLRQIRNGGNIAKIIDIYKIPGKRLSYWLPSSVVQCYADLPSLAGSVESVDKGMSTTDDYRFIRTTWEVPAVLSPKGWMYYSKGGEYSPFVSDVHLAVNWHDEGREISSLIIAKYPYLKGDSGWVLHPETHHGYAGLTYTKRTTSSFSARFLPTGARVSDLANLVFDTDLEKILGALVCLSTSPFHYLLDAAVPSIDSSAGGTAARHYEVGTLREVPVPTASFNQHAGSGVKLFRLAQQRYSKDETTIFFNGMPSLFGAESLLIASCDEEKTQLKAQVDMIQLHAQVERSFIKEFSLDEIAIAAVYDYMGPHPADLPQSNLSQLISVSDVWKQSQEKLTSLLIQNYGGKRRFSKQTWVGGREIELWAYVSNLEPAEIVRVLGDDSTFMHRNLPTFVSRVASFLLGIVLGRWEIHFAIGEFKPLDLFDPFTPLPACLPAMLQNNSGLPAKQKDISCDYPLRISWAGILVDDEYHSENIVARVREAIRVIWKDSSETIEHEICDVLCMKTLRDYFCHPTAFFVEHLNRYSKSRRQAPIYWPLQTQSGSYTLLVYYHRLTEQTLYTCVNDFVEPKLKAVTDDLNCLRNKSARSSAEEKEFAKLSDLEAELKDFRDELLHIVKFWKPNLNDGVQITAAPLWKLFQHKTWQKKLKETWESLEKGDYDWAHLAYSIWPERVLRKCHEDRSLAIAHDVEVDFWEEVESPTIRRGKDSGETKAEWQPRKLTENQLTELIRQKLAEAS